MGSSKTEELNALFGEWRQGYGSQSACFAEDGIVDENAWSKAKRKVLFLLKETNRYVGDFRKLVREGPWKVLGHWAHGLHDTTATHSPPFPEAKEMADGACIASAVVNLKKTAGEATTDNLALLAEVKRAKNTEFLHKELRIISSDVVVCGGTFEIAREVVEELRGATPCGPDGRCYEVGNAVWIKHCHPSVRWPHDMTYYALMAFYSNYFGIAGT